MAPTEAEVEEHLPLHLNYRSWCQDCRTGRGRQAPHIIEPHVRDKFGIAFCADYTCLTLADNEEDMKPSLLMYDDGKDVFWAIGFESKGLSELIVKYVKGVLDMSGYEGEKITFNMDQEPSIIALK